jgi:L-aminopeptidase/D-esterase-like protein
MAGCPERLSSCRRAGTRETDALHPWNAVQRVHAVVLTGGSVFGLAAVDGVMRRLHAEGRGVAVGTEPDHVVPIVPAAVVFDLGRGGRFTASPDAELGVEAYDAALAGTNGAASGVLGAGTGTQAAGLKGGLGTASLVLPNGTTVGALAVVNPLGSCVNPATGELYAGGFARENEYGLLRRPSAADVQRAASTGLFGVLPAIATNTEAQHTTLGVVVTDAALSKAQCGKMAAMAHDGMARAIRPVHTMFDGDTVFGLSTGDGQPCDMLDFHAIMTAADDCFTRAVGHAVLAADTVTTPTGGELLSYRDAFPSAFDS